MANVSFSIVRGTDIDLLGQSGSQSITVGTLAPNAGDLEVRISTTNGITKNEVELLMDTIWRFLMNPSNSNVIPL